MARLEVLVGPIASGKSTFARRRAAEGALVISHDDLCRMLHAGLLVGPGSCGYLPELRDCYHEMEESLAWAALSQGRDVVVDRTHLTRESRRRWIRWAAGYDSLNDFDGQGPTTPVVAVAFPIENHEVHAWRRSIVDPRGRSYEEWLAVAKHHALQVAADPLSEDEGFAEILRIGAPEGVTLG